MINNRIINSLLIRVTEYFFNLLQYPAIFVSFEINFLEIRFLTFINTDINNNIQRGKVYYYSSKTKRNRDLQMEYKLK